MGRPAHCGWHHSLPEILDWINGGKRLSSSEHHSALPDHGWDVSSCSNSCCLDCSTMMVYWPVDQNQSFTFKFLSSEYFMVAKGEENKECPHATVLTIFLFNCQTLLPIACFMRFYINISSFLKTFRFSFLRALVSSKTLVICIVSLFCYSVLLKGVSMTLVIGKKHLSLPTIALVLDFLQKC